MTQKGVGRTLIIAKYSAIATKAVSPPESSESVVSAFPGGWTLMSMSQVSTSSPGSSVSSALPPPKSSVKVSRKLSFIAVNSRVNILLISPVISEIIPSSSFFAFSTSSRWEARNSYLSLTRAYSSMAPRFGVPRADISFFSSAMRLFDFAALSMGFLTASAALWLSS